MQQERRLNPAEIDDVVEEDVDVERVIADVEEKLADFISSDNRKEFDEFFDATRRSYADPEAQGEWKQLFDEIYVALNGAQDDEDAVTILRDYVKKANGLG